MAIAAFLLGESVGHTGYDDNALVAQLLTDNDRRVEENNLGSETLKMEIEYNACDAGMSFLVCYKDQHTDYAAEAPPNPNINHVSLPGAFPYDEHGIYARSLWLNESNFPQTTAFEEEAGMHQRDAELETSLVYAKETPPDPYMPEIRGENGELFEMEMDDFEPEKEPQPGQEQAENVQHRQDVPTLLSSVPNNTSILLDSNAHGTPVALIADLSWPYFPGSPSNQKCKYAVLGYFRIENCEVRLSGVHIADRISIKT